MTEAHAEGMAKGITRAIEIIMYKPWETSADLIELLSKEAAKHWEAAGFESVLRKGEA